MDISGLKKLVGTKLLWVGTDPGNGFTYFLFDNMAAVATTSDCELLPDGSGVMKNILTENIFAAENVVELKTIMEKNDVAKPAAPQEASRAPSPPNGGGGADPIG